MAAQYIYPLREGDVGWEENLGHLAKMMRRGKLSPDERAQIDRIDINGEFALRYCTVEGVIKLVCSRSRKNGD